MTFFEQILSNDGVALILGPKGQVQGEGLENGYVNCWAYPFSNPDVTSTLGGVSVYRQLLNATVRRDAGTSRESLLIYNLNFPSVESPWIKDNPKTAVENWM